MNGETSKVQVALIDDAPEEGELYRRYLAEMAVPATLIWHAETISEAVEALATTEPEILFLDHSVPPFLTVNESLPRLRETGYIGPIIATSMARNIAIGASAQAELAGRLAKDELTPELLFETIARCLPSKLEA